MTTPADPFPQPYQRLTATAAGLTLLTVALWGGNPVATRFSVDALPPVTVSGLRFLMATGVMLVWCWLEGVSFRITRPQVVPILVAGTLLFLQITLFTVGAAWTSSSHTSLLVNTFVFWVVGIEHFVTRSHRLTTTSTLGLLLAAVGAAALLWDAPGNAKQSDPPSLIGDAIMLVSALLLGLKFIYTKRVLAVIGPTELIFWHDIVAVVQFAIAACLLERPEFTHVAWPAWIGLMYQGLLVGGVCFALQAHLLKRHSASQIAVFSFLTPLFGIVLGMLFRGDQLSSGLVLSGMTVAAGIYLVNR
ncbi:MAG TPA: DMT family transporter [Planctomycetaceae bacterium]|nr:DMT family transporter [Planctomycetaceae bacterium]